MLGKLLKHEWKATAKLLIPLDILLILITIIGKIVLSTNLMQNESLELLTVALACLYIFALIALSVITYVFLIVRFYKNIFGDEGYLMHTLPVTPWSLLNAKLIMATFWGFLTTILCIASVCCLASSAITVDNAKDILSYSELNQSFTEEMGMTLTGFIWIIILFSLLGIISSLLTIYMSLAIGQLFEKHKIAAAVLAYFVIRIVMQLVSSLLLIVTNVGDFLTTSNDIAPASSIIADFYRSLFSLSGVETLILSVVFYIVTGMLMKKKLNLD